MWDEEDDAVVSPKFSHSHTCCSSFSAGDGTNILCGLLTLHETIFRQIPRQCDGGSKILRETKISSPRVDIVQIKYALIKLSNIRRDGERFGIT